MTPRLIIPIVLVGTLAGCDPAHIRTLRVEAKEPFATSATEAFDSSVAATVSTVALAHGLDPDPIEHAGTPRKGEEVLAHFRAVSERRDRPTSLWITVTREKRPGVVRISLTEAFIVLESEWFRGVFDDLRAVLSDRFGGTQVSEGK